MLKFIYYIVIICFDYEKLKVFYIEIFGFGIMKEIYWKECGFYKFDLVLDGVYVIELFFFFDLFEWLICFEVVGFWYFVFIVNDFEAVVWELKEKGIEIELIRIDLLMGKCFIFFFDFDKFLFELYEV